MNMSMLIEEWDIGKLREYENNPRKNDRVVGQMEESIREYGFRVPVLVKGDGEVIDGHLRLKAARKMGLGTVPVIRVDDLSEEKIKAFRLLVNRSVDWAVWDDEGLGRELRELMEVGFDLNLTGFSTLEIDELLKEAEQEIEDLGVGGGDDEGEDLGGEVRTKRGDVWVMDGHRLLCGDSTNREEVSKLFGDLRVNLCVTDPPYGVNYEPGWQKERIKGIRNSNYSTGKVLNDDRSDWSEVWEIFCEFGGSVIYCWSPSGDKMFDFYNSLKKVGFEVRQQIIWRKNLAIISRGNYNIQHEVCWYGVKKGGRANWQGANDATTVWDIQVRQKKDTGHSTQKPLECMKYPIGYNSRRGDIVYDPFMGSGTTLIACEQMGRRCLGVELNEEYVDMAVRRWESETGKVAVLEE
jgi:DNA modification methylase